MAKLARLLNLTAALLDTETALTAEEIRERIPGYPDAGTAFHRAFERDKDELRALGIPLETVTVLHHETPRAAYTIDQARYSAPDPGLERDELLALHVARAAVMFEGIDANDVDETFWKLGGIGAVGDGGGGALGSIPLSRELEQIFTAINDRRTLSFDYGTELRLVEPQSMHFERGRWYLIAYDRSRSAVRHFRIDRIAGDTTLGDQGSFTNRDLGTALVTSPWAAGTQEPTTVRILIDMEPAQATLAEYSDLEVIETNDDGSILVEIEMRSGPGLFGFMAGLLDRAEILEPTEVRSEYVQWLTDRAARDGSADLGATP